MRLNYECVIFDLDNTIYDERDYFKGTFKAICELLESDEKNQDKIFDICVNELSTYGTAAPNFFLHLVHVLNLDEKYHKTFYELHKKSREKISLYDDAKNILHSLKESKKKIAIITNGGAVVQRNKINLLGIGDLFDCICIARDVGAEKPNQEPYAFVMNQLSVSGQDCIYIGDNPHIDFSAAKELGMTTIRLRRGDLCHIVVNEDQIDYTYDNFEQVEATIL
jgi:putative hydrolase of the HAD superfamily